MHGPHQVYQEHNMDFQRSPSSQPSHPLTSANAPKDGTVGHPKNFVTQPPFRPGPSMVSRDSFPFSPNSKAEPYQHSGPPTSDSLLMIQGTEFLDAIQQCLILSTPEPDPALPNFVPGHTYSEGSSITERELSSASSKGKGEATADVAVALAEHNMPLTGCDGIGSRPPGELDEGSTATSSSFCSVCTGRTRRNGQFLPFVAVPGFVKNSRGCMVPSRFEQTTDEPRPFVCDFGMCRRSFTCIAYLEHHRGTAHPELKNMLHPLNPQQG